MVLGNTHQTPPMTDRETSDKTCFSTAAEPLSPSQGDPAWSTGCDIAVQGHLDLMEETAEKAVEHLEAEVKGLLDLLEELAWNLPPGSFSPAPDLLGDDRF
ncbi:placenta-specific protein 9 isoform X1 [Sciurus carolinensis]|uniref:placenta-specific protein 9 isoform X1 n=1 Tax=Sciurus carolinensis TaxID=30640 RepID=UPI001FB55A51|nr:placenta-specific protein 9 isoform X1 [Sciurus carolinensis]